MTAQLDEMQDLWNKAFGTTPGGPLAEAPQTEIEDEIDAAMAKLRSKLQETNSLRGRTIVVTGKLQNFTRQQVVTAIREKGGACPNSVTRDTVALVAGSKPGLVKVTAAIKKGIPIMTEDQLMLMMAGSG
jgi:NAD-dependent DNA ligase